MGRSLDGRVAVVTGASSEIGATMADALAADGAAVVLAYHDAPGLAEDVTDRIVAAGGHALAVEADLSRVSENRRLVDHTVAELGRLDVFVANAGLTHWSPFLELEEADWDTVVDLNLKGSTFGAQAAARQMVVQGKREPDDPYGGRIVFSTSVTGLVVVPNLTAYAATKAALAHLASALAVELGPHGITVNALGIGATVNERNLADDPTLRGALGRSDPDGPGRHAAGRRGRPPLPRRAGGRDGERPHAGGRRRLGPRGQDPLGGTTAGRG